MNICDFPGKSRCPGAPRGWDQELDGPIVGLPIIDAVDTRTGRNMMYSVWKPDEDDLRILNAGGGIRLGIMGEQHPVVNMLALHPEIMAEAMCVEIK